MIIGQKDGVHVCSVVVVGMMVWQAGGDLVRCGGIEGEAGTHDCISCGEASAEFKQSIVNGMSASDPTQIEMEIPSACTDMSIPNYLVKLWV